MQPAFTFPLQQYFQVFYLLDELVNCWYLHKLLPGKKMYKDKILDALRCREPCLKLLVWEIWMKHKNAKRHNAPDVFCHL